MPTLAQLFNQYNFPSIRFVYWDISFNCPLNELELTKVNNIERINFKNHNQLNLNNIFDNRAPNMSYQYYYPHIINIDINLTHYPNQNLREIAENYYLNIIKTNEYNNDEINNIIQNYFINH